MAVNSIGSMRSSGRSPPFLALGLLIALVILGFNYWSLSKRNGEQANEIALFESELRLISAQKMSAEKRSETISIKVKDLEDDIMNLKQEIKTHKITIDEEKDVIRNLQQDKSDLESRLTVADQDLNTAKTETLPALKREYAEKMKELHQVQDRYYELQKEQSHCDESKCMVYIKSYRDKLLEDVFKVAGSAPLIKLKNAGVDVKSLAAQLKELPTTEPPQLQTLIRKAKYEQNVQVRVVTQNEPTSKKKSIPFQPDILQFERAKEVIDYKNEAPEKQDDIFEGQEKSKQEVSNVKLEDNKKIENVVVETEKEKPVEGAIIENDEDGKQVLPQNYQGDGGDIDEGANEDDDMDDDADIIDNKDQDDVLQDIDRVNNENDEMQENMDKDQLQ